MIQKKICMLGGFAVGKTSMVARFVSSIFSDKYLSTVGVKIDKKTVTIDGCDVVLVCHPELVPESLAAVEGRDLNTMALAGLIGRGPLAWEGLLADTRYDQAHARFGGDIA